MKNPQSAALDSKALGDLCFAHLVEAPDELARFMEYAGFDPARLRRSLGTDDLALGLIDYFANNEPLLLALCANNDLKPEAFMRMWHRLNPGA